MKSYNTIGKTYNSTRFADDRITNKIEELIGIKPGEVIADIGAGTGNYAFN